MQELEEEQKNLRAPLWKKKRKLKKNIRNPANSLDDFQKSKIVKHFGKLTNKILRITRKSKKKVDARNGEKTEKSECRCEKKKPESRESKNIYYKSSEQI